MISVYVIIAVSVFITIGILVLTHRSSGGNRKSRLKRASDAARAKVLALPLKLRHDKTDREIYDAISFVRNIVAAGNSAALTPDKLLSQFSDRGGTLGMASLKALALLRMGKVREAGLAFAQTAGTKSAADFIGILLRFDNISPEKLASTLGAYQAAMKEFRTTRLKRRNETLSDLVFLPVIVNVMAVFMNFVIVAYFLSQKNQLLQMFF